MNLVALVGNLVRDPEVTVRNDKTITRFAVACTRKFKNADGNYEADFINCVAFGKTAEFVEKYFTKGKKIALTGEIRNNNYTKDNGEKVYSYDIVVNEVEFVLPKSADSSSTPSNGSDGFMNIPDGAEDNLPFN